jgi:hypothetical membrane protein
MTKMGKTNWKILLLESSYLTGFLAMFILPVFGAPGYSIIRNTLSELGAQSAPFAWIMNSVFIILALSSIIAGWEYFEDFLLHRIVLLLCSASLMLTAFFNHAPANPDILYNIKESGWHAYFAGTAILSFTILSISTSFILEKQYDRILSVTAGISIILLSLLMSEAERYSGIWQRLVYIITFGWMIYMLKTREKWISGNQLTG